VTFFNETEIIREMEQRRQDMTGSAADFASASNSNALPGRMRESILSGAAPPAKETLGNGRLGFPQPRFELLSPQGAYNLLFTRRARVLELYVRWRVACGFPMHRYITPFYFSRKKASVAFPLLLLALPVKSYTRSFERTHAHANDALLSSGGHRSCLFSG